MKVKTRNRVAIKRIEHFPDHVPDIWRIELPNQSIVDCLDYSDISVDSNYRPEDKGKEEEVVFFLEHGTVLSSDRPSAQFEREEELEKDPRESTSVKLVGRLNDWFKAEDNSEYCEIDMGWGYCYVSAEGNPTPYKVEAKVGSMVECTGLCAIEV